MTNQNDFGIGIYTKDTRFSFLAGSITEIRQFAYQKHANPCDNIVALSSKNDDLAGNSTIKSKILIDANNKVFNASTLYKTGKSILLKPGFKVINGAVFKTAISANPCD